MDHHLDDYRAKIEAAAKNRENKAIPNGTMDHAFIGIESLIKHSERSVLIVSNHFHEPFWRKLESTIYSFLAKSSNYVMEIIVLKKLNFDGILKQLKIKYPEQVKIYDYQNESVENKIPNFVSITPFGYRYETSDDKKEDRIVQGIINFGDESNSNRLKEFFGLLRDKSKEISPSK